MKILLSIPCWHRPELVAMLVRNIEAVISPYAEVIPFFILSPEDPYYKALRQITKDYYHFDVANNPLGHKKNEALKEALHIKWDYFMEMGSDNLFTNLLWEFYADYFVTGNEYFGLKNIYIYEPYKHRAVFMEGYHIGWHDEVTALGVGRCVRRDIVERAMPLWEDESPFGMDGYSDSRIGKIGYKCSVIDNEYLPVICDIKGTVCLTSWMQWEECGQPADADWVKDQFGINNIECYDLSKFDNFHKAVMKVSEDFGNRVQAFEYINQVHEMQMGVIRYNSYDSFRKQVTRTYNKK